MNMELCAKKTFGESWDCIRESNGELLPIILFAECMWWLIVLLGMRFGVQSIRGWFRERRIRKQQKIDWENKWSFPPKRNN